MGQLQIRVYETSTTKTNMLKKQTIKELNQLMLSKFKHKLLIMVIIIIIQFILEYFQQQFYYRQTLKRVKNKRKCKNQM
jgi:hypothetical protein